MKKRILSTIIALLLIIPTFLMTGCKKEDNVVILAGSDATPMTITLYSIVDGEVDESVRASVEAAINEITEFEFNTHIDLRLYSDEAEYLEDLYTNLEYASENQSTTVGAVAQSKESVKLELATDENGETKYVEVRKEAVEYPAAEENQVDIFLVSSIDQYNRHVTNGEVMDLSAMLLTGTDYAILNKYINSTLMKATTLANDVDNKSVYAIPNNRVIGEYEYFLVNKALAEEKGFTGEGFNANINELEPLLVQLGLISAPMDFDAVSFAEGEADPAPTETKLLSNDKYTFVYADYEVEPEYETFGDNTYIGAYYGDAAESPLKADQSVAAWNGNLLYNSGFTNDMAVLSKYVSNEKVGDTVPACMFVKGPSTIKSEYEDDYLVFTYKAPVASNETAYNSMYGINGFMDEFRAERCLEIITYMQTNEEFANIFRYGVEGVHFEKDENNIVTIYNNDDEVPYTNFMVAPEYAGNMFLHYSNTDMTEYERAFAYDNWTLAKEQNHDNTYFSSYFGFSAASYEITRWTKDSFREKPEGDVTPAETVAQINALSEEYASVFDKYVGAELNAIMVKYAVSYEDDEMVYESLNTNRTNSIKMRYEEWQNVNYPKEETQA